jgi:RNA polymerase sigma-70 factor, ECF subfamily
MASRIDEWDRVLAALARGDRVAYVRVSGLVMGLLARLRLSDLQPHWDDIAQEVLVQVIHSVRTGAIRDTDRFVGYCATLTRREGFRWLRRLSEQRDRTSRMQPEDVHAVSGRSDDPDVRVQLARALDDLPEKQRKVMDAIYLCGYTYEEAARELGMPLGTLKRAQTEALRDLREKLGIT